MRFFYICFQHRQNGSVKEIKNYKDVTKQLGIYLLISFDSALAANKLIVNHSSGGFVKLKEFMWHS